ncbi:MAG: hypothetical protein KDE45_00300 [Caldilineaceae bacterium]|nr:hypothetical protein [Caldilineaceae bacterium]
MRSAPVNFRLLRHLLTVARVDDELAESGKSGGTALRQMITQLDLYAPSDERDNLRALVDLAIEQRGMLDAVGMALDRWTFGAASTQQRASARRGIQRKIASEAGNEAKAKDAADKHAEWQEEANRLWRLKYDRKKADVAAEVAENCGGGTAGYIQSIIRKPPKLSR